MTTPAVRAARSWGRWGLPAACLAVAVTLGSARPTAAEDLPPFPAPQPAGELTPPPLPPWPLEPSQGESIPVPAFPAPAAPVEPSAEAPEAPRFSREQTLELVGPVALYPDVVLASLLPATTFPLDVVAAARHVRAHRENPAPPVGVSWDASVQALMQYPDILLWLDDNLPWLEQMGLAVAEQQGDVLWAIQEFRRRAEAVGNLKSNDYQEVVLQPATAPEQPPVIVIQPPSPEVVYVPVYDPVVVVQPVPVYMPAPVVCWGIGFTFWGGGPWTCHDFDWWWWDDWHHHHHPVIRCHPAPYSWHSPRHHVSSVYSPVVFHGHRSYARSHASGSSVYGPRAAGGHAAYAVRTPARPSWGGGSAPLLRSGGERVRPTPDMSARTYRPGGRSGRESPLADAGRGATPVLGPGGSVALPREAAPTVRTQPAPPASKWTNPVPRSPSSPAPSPRWSGSRWADSRLGAPSSTPSTGTGARPSPSPSAPTPSTRWTNPVPRTTVPTPTPTPRWSGSRWANPASPPATAAPSQGSSAGGSGPSASERTPTPSTRWSNPVPRTTVPVPVPTPTPTPRATDSRWANPVPRAPSAPSTTPATRSSSSRWANPAPEAPAVPRTRVVVPRETPPATAPAPRSSSTPSSRWTNPVPTAPSVRSSEPKGSNPAPAAPRSSEPRSSFGSGRSSGRSTEETPPPPPPTSRRRR